MTLNHLGNVECADCGGSHAIMKNNQGLLVSLEKCHGKVPNTPTREQNIEMVDGIRHAESVFSELKSGYEECDWDSVRACIDEITIKLNTIAITASEIEKS